MGSPQSIVGESPNKRIQLTARSVRLVEGAEAAADAQMRWPELREHRLTGSRAQMIDLYDNETNRLLGSITESELQLLVDALEEESSKDQDYYINQDTIGMIADGRASDHLLQLLRSALGTADGVEISWKRR
jgi:hypothetical protein